MVSAQGLTRHFGRFAAVDSIDFRIPRGQVVGFLGPNGAGKTTTIRMIAGFLPPTRGRILVDGLDVALHGRRIRQGIGYLPETSPLYGEMRVQEYLRFRWRLFGMPRARRRTAIDLAARRCGLVEVLARPIQQLSRGYRQRVGLAAAILHEPPLLILDEPTVGLDPTQILEVRQLIRELAGRHTILLSTHILPEVEMTCDRILLIARGRLWADGTIDEIRSKGHDRATVSVEVQPKDEAEAHAAISAMPGVADVTRDRLADDWRRLTVRFRDGAGDLRLSIAQALHQRGCIVRELHRHTPTLEEIFVRVVAKAEAESARDSGPLAEVA